ncbi:MAG: 2-amino-4-hydroxy-6-hydroxymethyldihydropteridine diphosphokinase [Halioglobus sp.]|nr:2-amino-4-hydroxy-6-hydroxymethyldihydropteridine diphosphokinase [Halioglobus sp.]
MTPAYIALGSNLQSPIAQLRRAVAALAGLAQSRVTRVSGVYRSAPVGPPGQPDYLNAAVCLQTRLAPHALLDALQDIETRQGRVRTQRWGPRTLDLDLLLYGDITLDDERLTLPHPRMHERDFVLLPLQEISVKGLTMPDGRELEHLVQQCRSGSLHRTNCHLQAP